MARGYQWCLTMLIVGTIVTMDLVAEAKDCQLDIGQLPSLSGDVIHKNFEECLHASSEGVLHRLVNSLKGSFEERLAEQDDIRFIYFYGPREQVQFSVKEYRNKTGLYTYFRKGAGSDAETIFSRRKFKDDSGVLTYFRLGKDNEATFLSERQFHNDHGVYSFWREGYNDDSKSFFTMRSFQEEGTTFHYYRTSTQDASTFLSTKIRRSKQGDYTIFRSGYGATAKTIMTVNGDLFRDGQGRRLTKSQAIALLEKHYWGPLLAKSLDMINANFTPVISAFPQSSF